MPELGQPAGLTVRGGRCLVSTGNAAVALRDAGQGVRVFWKVAPDERGQENQGPIAGAWTAVHLEAARLLGADEEPAVRAGARWDLRPQQLTRPLRPLLDSAAEIRALAEKAIPFMEKVATSRARGLPVRIRSLAMCGSAGLVAYSLSGRRTSGQSRNKHYVPGLTRTYERK